MYIIQQVTNDSLQKRTLVLPDGTQMTFTMYFVPMQLCWVITELVYQDFILHGLKVSNSPNMLFQWRNIIPFGLACYSTANREPSLQDDFSSGASVLYLLDESDVDAYAEFLANG